MPYSKIKEIHVRLWDKYDVRFKANADVNIIIGINGSGKTTLLTELNKVALGYVNDKNRVVMIPTIDNIDIRDKRRTYNALTQELEFYIYDMKTGPSMMYHRMSMIDASEEKQAEMKARIEEFCSIINELFQETKKHIEIEGNKFNIVSSGQILPIDALSSGEKLILLIMLRIFLLDGKESYVLLDEPENSLDISWQYKLIDTLVKFNPNAQFFITTHSPNFGDINWRSRTIRMEDVTTPIE